MKEIRSRKKNILNSQRLNTTLQIKTASDMFRLKHNEIVKAGRKMKFPLC